MRIFQLLDKFRFGGGENVAVNYAKVLNKLKIENYIVAEYFDNKFLENLEKNKIKYLSKKNLKENDKDTLFVHTNRNLLKLFLKYKFKNKRPKIYYIQHLNYSKKKMSILSKMINSICDGFIQITPIIENNMSKYIKIKKYFFPNFYINKYSINERDSIRNKIREQLNFLPKDYVVTFSGMFKKGKNVSHIIKLAKEFKEYNNIKFLILGDGPENAIIKNNLQKNIIWLGLVDDVEKYLLATDLYFFSSINEMMPMALIEAINANLPIVAYNTEINKYLLEYQFIVENIEEAKERILEFYNLDFRTYNHKNKFDFEFGIKNLKKILWS
ncbi:hypothetical protein X275_00620 [Marinitoga sp. 1197]|nr:hypothetical protein X275_00620 [Marinitoga sp. 1197]